ncbi:addiction module protein [bacterium]|nr:addiction module protein [bacterium]
MTQSTKVLLKRALTLNPVDRAELIEALFRSFDRRRSKRNDARWAAEAESRIDAYRAGKMGASSAEAVFDRIGAR